MQFAYFKKEQTKFKTSQYLDTAIIIFEFLLFLVKSV